MAGSKTDPRCKSAKERKNPITLRLDATMSLLGATLGVATPPPIATLGVAALPVTLLLPLKLCLVGVLIADGVSLAGGIVSTFIVALTVKHLFRLAHLDLHYHLTLKRGKGVLP